ncbi:hypothetical protein [Longispora sp. NPDC051575]|uniref:hypothetical protein n=1 Tax=Longispora sp. NPDC051575 TaxID=3154943 RepID=UPI0034305AE8
MRVVRCSTLPVLVRIADRDDVLVSVPACLSTEDVLSLAFLVLCREEYCELSRELALGVGELVVGRASE